MSRRLTLILIIIAMVGAVCTAPCQDSAPTQEPEGTITLRWQIDSANNNYGFFLERSDDKEEPWVRVNERLIPGVGTSSDINKFTYTDEGLVRGNDYFYNLYEVAYDGTEELMGTIPAHCRTVEEDVVHERRRLLGLAVAEMDNVTSPIISGEFVAFLYPRNGQSVTLVAEWADWEENPIEMKLLRGTQMWIAEEPIATFEAGVENGYLYLVTDPNNENQGTDGERDVSVFTID